MEQDLGNGEQKRVKKKVKKESRISNWKIPRPGGLQGFSTKDLTSMHSRKGSKGLQDKLRIVIF